MKLNPPLPQLLEMIERLCVVEAMAKFNGNTTKAAEYLGVKRTALIYKRRKHGLEVKCQQEKKEKH